jgi:hypothetical protein
MEDEASKEEVQRKQFPRDSLREPYLDPMKIDSNSRVIPSLRPPDLIAAKALKPFGQSQAGRFF